MSRAWWRRREESAEKTEDRRRTSLFGDLDHVVKQTTKSRQHFDVDDRRSSATSRRDDTVTVHASTPTGPTDFTEGGRGELDRLHAADGVRTGHSGSPPPVAPRFHAQNVTENENWQRYASTKRLDTDRRHTRR